MKLYVSCGFTLLSEDCTATAFPLKYLIANFEMRLDEQKFTT